VVFDGNRKFVAVGLYDPGSPIRVRALTAGRPRAVDGAFWAERVAAADARRAGLFEAAGPLRTDGYRRVNGESDGFPGLVVDRYGDTQVVKAYTAAWLPHLGALLPELCPGGEGSRVVLRLSRNAQAAARELCGAGDGDVVRGPPLGGDGETALFSERGLRFEANVVRGQKTGFFLDQRDNRARVGELVREAAAARGGATALNCFSFSGGFSLYAARAGASRVVSVDISRHALESGERNFALNRRVAGVAACAHESVKADCFEFLGQCRDRFDVVVTDPPSMARRRGEAGGAARAYHRLAALGAARTRPGGAYVAASCSAHVGTEDFVRAALDGARAGAPGGRVQLEAVHEHAPDHPVAIPEMQYLKAATIRVF